MRYDLSGLRESLGISFNFLEDGATRRVWKGGAGLWEKGMGGLQANQILTSKSELFVSEVCACACVCVRVRVSERLYASV